MVWRLKINAAKMWQKFWKQEEGMGVVEIILIIVVLIGLVIIFRDNIQDLITDIFETMVENAGEIG